jgi:hypothetical protein
MNMFSVSAFTLGSISLAAMAFAGPSAPREAVSTFDQRPAAFDVAFERIVSASANPAATRGTLLMRMGGSPACYPDDLTPEEWEAIFQATGLLPPADGVGDGVQVRYYVELDAWVGEAQIDTSGRAQAAHLTYSFPSDGTMWGVSASGLPTGANTLNAELVNTFGELDRGREFIRQAIASWRLNTGVRYTEVGDDDTAMSQVVGRVLARGDIRIGGTNMGAGVLAYNAYPLGNGSSSLSGGDMVINTFYFLGAYLASPGSDYRYLRNTIAHEHGHGLGLRHAIPCDTTKIMEPTVGGSINGIQIDDIRGGQRNYGDRFSGNRNATLAVQLGELGSPSPVSVYLPTLSTNGLSGFNSTGEDWYTFTLATPRAVTIAADPFGGVYTTAPQTSGCAGSPLTEINAQAAGNLKIELRRPATTLVQEVNANGAGVGETLNAGTLAAGTYFVRIRDVAADNAANQRVQLYDLRIRTESALYPPLAFAGLNKRVQAGTNCWLMGHIHSRALEPGASVASYVWDLNGDGAFETPGSPATFQYVSNGTHQAVLRVTDSNGKSATDTINVVVWGASTLVSTVSPPGASPGASVAVTINGANFKGVTSSAQVTVSGTGISVTGTPIVNALGTQITGLSFVVAAGTPFGDRTVTITNSDGQGAVGSGVGVFSVGNVTGACCYGTTCLVTNQNTCTATGGSWLGVGAVCGAVGNPTSCCPANFDGVGGVQVPDIFAFLSAWFAGDPAANIDGANGVGVPDIFAFLSLWFAGC